ncbi:MAG: aspartate aminotransferase family protein [Lachnospiraceae bacterium]|nr:aspartate aminotransferase family protein [Lachnospiraceae bacterium]
MSSKDIMEKGEKYLLHTYNRYPIVLERGEGVYLYDTDGNKYLDFGAGIAVFALGYGNSKFNDAIKAQTEKLIHTSNLFYNVPAVEAAEKICALTGLDRVFFTNSGTEAIEGAIKAARKVAYTRDSHTDHEMIAMEHSFHGRSYGALSVTGNPHYREPFGPGIGNIKFAKFNDLDSVKALINDKTCGIIFETVQGEGGIYPATEEFIKGVRQLCDEKGILLILDEIQCGMGRTGSMFAFEKYGVRPDILTLAKALGCGIPVGAFLMSEAVAEKSLVPGDHGSTYGGNPLATAAVCEVLRQFEEKDIVGNVRNLSPLFEDKLNGLKNKYGFIKDVRGAGFMRAIELDRSVGDIVKEAQKMGLIVLTAGANIIRLVPPLVIGEEDINEMYRILDEVFSKIE